MTPSSAADCVFCRIVAGTLPASIVEQDDTIVAFLDPRQVHGGHTLVVPKLHVETIFDLDAATGAALMSALTRVAAALRTVVPSDGLSVWQSNGPGAYQEVPHVHFHLMPRRTGDGLLRIYPGRIENVRREDLDQQAELIRGALRAFDQ